MVKHNIAVIALKSVYKLKKSKYVVFWEWLIEHRSERDSSGTTLEGGGAEGALAPPRNLGGQKGEQTIETDKLLLLASPESKS
jgi:hypothetical protein